MYNKEHCVLKRASGPSLFQQYESCARTRNCHSKQTVLANLASLLTFSVKGKMVARKRIPLQSESLIMTGEKISLTATVQMSSA